MKKLITILASVVMIVCIGVLSFNAPAKASTVDDFIQLCNSDIPSIPNCDVLEQFEDDYYSRGVVKLDEFYPDDLKSGLKEACVPTDSLKEIVADKDLEKAADLKDDSFVLYLEKEAGVISCELYL